MIKAAIIGYGYSAKTFHLPFISSMAKYSLSAICSRKCADAKTSWPGVEIFTSAADLIPQTDAELIIITTPNDSHYSLAKLALECNKHVILEKPFVTNLRQGEELIQLASSRGRVLSVFHNRRWDGGYLTIKNLISTSTLGDTRYFESRFDRFRPQVRNRWREQPGEGVGVWYDLGPHLIDQALCLFGLPESVTARCLALRPGSTVTDYFHVQLHYPDIEVVLRSSPFSSSPCLRFQLQGTEGCFIKYGMDPQESRLKAGTKPIGDEWAMEDESSFGKLRTSAGCTTIAPETGAYQRYFDGVARSIRTGISPPVTAEEALSTIKIIELAMRSSELGRTLSLLG